MDTKERSDQIFGGIFLIGLAALFFTGYWWPGILFVAGAASVGRAVMMGRPLQTEMGGLIALGLGLVFALGDFGDLFGGSWWPVLLIVAGLYMLFGHRLPGRGAGSDKPKNTV